MYTVGLSSCGKVINEALMEAYRTAGIGAMEVAPGMNGFKTLDRSMTKRLAEEYGIKLWSAHLPFAPFELIDISSLNADLRESSVKYLSEIIRQAAEMGIDKYVIHPSAEPIWLTEEKKERIKAAKESLDELSRTARTCGGYLAVENLPRSCVGNCATEMKELLSVSEDLRVCFDTNHLLSEDFEVLLNAVGDKIITVHISDYDFVNERHWLPGEGKLDWKRLLLGLENVGYQGPWLYEIGFSTPSSINRPRKLTCEDFVRNAKELFEGKELTVISTPVENLSFWG